MEWILTFVDEPLTNTVSTLCPRCFATTPRRLFLGKRDPLFQVTIEQFGDFAGALGFLILFNAREMCSLKRLFEFAVFFIGEGGFPR